MTPKGWDFCFERHIKKIRKFEKLTILGQHKKYFARKIFMSPGKTMLKAEFTKYLLAPKWHEQAHDWDYLRPKNVDFEVNEFLSRAWQKVCSVKRSDFKTFKHQKMLRMTPKSLELCFDWIPKKSEKFKIWQFSAEKKIFSWQIPYLPESK